jgi:DNA-binding GntR family transcriptional regulator
MKNKNSRVNKIADYLRKEIMYGNLKAGDQIKEHHLSKVFEVSRVPVREALRILHSEGYLDMIPNRGSFVRKISKDYFKEVTEMYLILAPVLLKDSIPRFKDSDFKKAYSVLKKIDNCTDFNKVGYLIWDFGKAIFGPSKLKFTMSVINEIYKHNIRALNDVFVKSSNFKYDTSAHKKFLELCKKKETSEAIKVWIEHSQRLSKNIAQKTIADD